MFDHEPEIFDPADIPDTVEGWEELIREIRALPRVGYLHAAWALARTSLYFLMREILSTSQWVDDDGKPSMAHPYMLDFCNAVQGDFHNVLDVAARGHVKSHTKTLALPIQQLLLNPEATIAIFSFTRQLAKRFLNQIKRELETNELLKAISWDFGLGANIFWANPEKEAPYWALNEGIVVNRRGNPREGSVEAWGLVEGMPTGRHFLLRLYDDVVVKDSTTTTDQIQKTTEAWNLSQALGMPGGQASYTGTFYKFGDTYTSMLEAGVRLRLRPCYEIKKLVLDEDKGYVKDLVVDPDKPVFFSKEHLLETEKAMSPSTWGTQYLCDPRAGEERGFVEEWIMRYKSSPEQEARGKSIYIVVDSANSKKKGSSYTSMWVIGLGPDRNYYILDGVRDRMNLEERIKELFKLHRRWDPVGVLYERYGMMADIPYAKLEMERQHYRFRITEVGGHVAKDDRIERLIPLFKSGQVFMPKEIRKTRVDGTRYDLLKEFIDEEFTKWPASDTADMLDSMARIAEPDVYFTWPKADSRKTDKWYEDDKLDDETRSWMVA